MEEGFELMSKVNRHILFDSDFYVISEILKFINDLAFVILDIINILLDILILFDLCSQLASSS